MVLYFLCITVIWVIILDLTDFMPTVKSWISSILTKGNSHNNDYRIKPFDCSLCMSWWSNFALMLCTGTLGFINILIALWLAWLTPIIKDIMILGFDALEKIIQKLHRGIYD